MAKSKFGRTRFKFEHDYVGPGGRAIPRLGGARLLTAPSILTAPSTMSNDSKPAESPPHEHSFSHPGPADNSVGSQANGQVSSTQTQASTSESLVSAQTPTEAPNREQLLDRARSFLVSPQVQNQDLPAKRAFLREKGLSEAEIENLLRTVVRAYLLDVFETLNISIQPLNPPSIPPRTYPQPPPSNLPVLLLGIVRLFTWLAGGSAALLFFYRVSCNETP